MACPQAKFQSYSLFDPKVWLALILSFLSKFSFTIQAPVWYTKYRTKNARRLFSKVRQQFSLVIGLGENFSLIITCFLDCFLINIRFQHSSRENILLSCKKWSTRVTKKNSELYLKSQGIEFLFDILFTEIFIFNVMDLLFWSFKKNWWSIIQFKIYKGLQRLQNKIKNKNYLFKILNSEKKTIFFFFEIFDDFLTRGIKAVRFSYLWLKHSAWILSMIYLNVSFLSFAYNQSEISAYFKASDLYQSFSRNNFNKLIFN